MLEWKISKEAVGYLEAMEFMEQRIAAIATQQAEEMVWLLEHPPLYTAGTSAKRSDLLSPQGFPVYETGRGGQYTYHGPGQRVAYVMLDLRKRNAMDVRAYVAALEQWIIATLAEFGVEGFVRQGRVGVWVQESEQSSVSRVQNTPLPNSELYSLTTESKIAAIGIRIRKWVTYHGICINLNPNLSHYSGIVPCGIREFGVTSLHQLGITASMQDLDAALKTSFTRYF